MKNELKSQLAKDLSGALYVCGLRDKLYELSEDHRISVEVRQKVRECYIECVVLLVCTIGSSKEIKQTAGEK
jgi:hypothetical protein